MIPNTDQALRMLSHRLLATLLPEFKSEYAMSDGAMVGLLMNAVADEVAEGIQRRLDDIGEMEQLLRTCDLTDSERAILEGALADYRLVTVNARHDALTRILIHWHALSEQQPSLAGLNGDIWVYLRRHAGRHVITAVP